MEPIVYKPFRYCAFVGWLLIGIAAFVCLWSVFFVISAPLLIIPGILLLRKSKVTVILDDSGVRLLNEKNSPDRLIPWEDLPCYRLDNDIHGYDLLLLSRVPIPPKVAKSFAWIPRFSTKLWYNGVLVCPLYCVGNADAVRKFAWQKCIHK